MDVECVNPSSLFHLANQASECSPAGLGSEEVPEANALLVPSFRTRRLENFLAELQLSDFFVKCLHELLENSCFTWTEGETFPEPTPVPEPT